MKLKTKLIRKPREVIFIILGIPENHPVNRYLTDNLLLCRGMPFGSFYINIAVGDGA